jgi:hypothetical protein
MAEHVIASTAFPRAMAAPACALGAARQAVTRFPAPLARGFAVAAILLTLARPAAAACVPAHFPADWLRQQEAAGSHIVARHVGKSDAWLVQRLLDDPRIAEASSYTDLATAQASIEAALIRHRDAADRWAAHAPANATRAWDYRMPSAIGRVASRPPGLDNVASARRLRVVLRKVAGGCVLVTSYPIR